jgi:hypothetical protein
MKKILVLTVLIMGYCLPAFSQVYRPLAVDSTLKFLPNTAENPSSLKSIQGNSYLNQYRLQNSKTGFSNDRADSKILSPETNMPIVNICKPDSSVRYTMLIKSF